MEQKPTARQARLEAASLALMDSPAGHRLIEFATEARDPADCADRLEGVAQLLI